MKKILSIFLIVITFFSFSFSVFAADAKLSADDVTIKAGETFDVVYKLSNNPGIMGFAFEFTFDSSALEVISVKRCDDFIGGVFNDSINVNTTNDFKVIWTGTENYTNNCDLFLVTFKAKESSNGKTYIECRCSLDDTFNEKWEDVKIFAETVQVNIEKSNSQSFWSRLVAWIKVIYNYLISLFA